jgi:anthranilate synthase/aminodeoxychorismate synthase-like glutamine amidotransferase
MILLLDNYDSFTWNLYDFLSQHHVQVEVYRNDAITTDEIESLKPEGIVISPGPKTPLEAGITMSTIDRFHKEIPILGICLGYQALGIYFGAQLIHSNVPVHGKTSAIHHNGDGLFANIPQQINVMRYHSLKINQWPECLIKTAETSDGQPMALRHKTLSLTGVQFHPESVLTEFGLQMLGNWLDTIK